MAKILLQMTFCVKTLSTHPPTFWPGVGNFSFWYPLGTHALFHLEDISSSVAVVGNTYYHLSLGHKNCYIVS